MRNTKLQRLLSPKGYKNPFGGIGVFSGYPKEVVAELLKIADFDYMGNASYEMGVIPQSLSCIAKNIRSMSLVDQTICGVSFHLIIEHANIPEYAQKIECWIREGNRDRCMEYHGLQDISRDTNPKNIIGWLDLDDHVLFFLNNKEGAVMAHQFYKALSA